MAAQQDGVVAAVPWRGSCVPREAAESGAAAARRAAAEAAAQRAVDEAVALEAQREARAAAEWRARDEAAAAAARAIAIEVTAAAAATFAAAQEAAKVAAAQRAVDEAAAAAARCAAEAASAQLALDEAAASAARAAAVAAEHEATESATRCAANERRASDARTAALAARDAAAAVNTTVSVSITPWVTLYHLDARQVDVIEAIGGPDYVEFMISRVQRVCRRYLDQRRLLARRAAESAAEAVTQARRAAEAAELAARSQPPPPFRNTEISPADFFTFSALSTPSLTGSAPRSPQCAPPSAECSLDVAAAAAAQRYRTWSAALPSKRANAVQHHEKKLSPSKAANLVMRQAVAAAATPLAAARVKSQHADIKAAAAMQRHEQLLEKHRVAKQSRSGAGARQQWKQDERASKEEMARLQRAATEAARTVAGMEEAQADTKPDTPRSFRRLPADSPPSTPPSYESDDDPDRWGARPWSSDDDTFDWDRLEAAASDRSSGRGEEERSWRRGTARKADARYHAALLLQREWRVLRRRRGRRVALHCEMAVTRLQSAWRGCLGVRTAQRLRSAAEEVARSVRQAAAEVAAQLVAEASEEAAMRLMMELAVEATHSSRCSGGRQRRKQRVRRQRQEATRQRCMAQAVDCSGLGAVDCQSTAAACRGGGMLLACAAP
jgi:hypothetical protein